MADLLRRITDLTDLADRLVDASSACPRCPHRTSG
jgi:hypothetical protein